jgi:16S rRNA G527 N7-methylase RsmG
MDHAAQFPLTTQVLSLLTALSIKVDCPSFLERIAVFQRVCSTWNLAAKLMSKGDIEERFDGHIADSLSLAGEIHAAPTLNYADIGSGGGFPAIPIALALPTRSCLMVERSQTKVDYLRQAIMILGAENLRVALGQFPCPIDLPSGRIYTARAVERPEAFDSALVREMEPGDVYLMQREPVHIHAAVHRSLDRVSDEFDRLGLRRGVLYRLRR